MSHVSTNKRAPITDLSVIKGTKWPVMDISQYNFLVELIQYICSTGLRKMWPSLHKLQALA